MTLLKAIGFSLIAFLALGIFAVLINGTFFIGVQLLGSKYGTDAALAFDLFIAFTSVFYAAFNDSNK